MDQVQIDKVLEHRWRWHQHGRYGAWYVDQHNSLEGGNATYTSLDISSAFSSRTVASDVAKSLNNAYEAGIKRGWAEVVKYLQDHDEEHAAELIMNCGSFDD